MHQDHIDRILIQLIILVVKILVLDYAQGVLGHVREAVQDVLVLVLGHV